MQKLTNILLIIVLATMSTVLPLNTEIMNIDISVDAPVTTLPPVPKYSFEAPEKNFNGEFGFGPSPLEEIALYFTTDSTFEDDFLKNFDIKIKIKEGAKEVKGIDISKLSFDIENGKAVVKISKEELIKDLPEGYYNILLSHDGKQYGYNLSTMKYNKKLTKTVLFSEIEHGQIPRAFYIMDKNEQVLVPIYKIKTDTLDWIGIYNELKMGTSSDFKLLPAPTMADSYSYWIENNNLRINYSSENLQKFSNPELIFESITRTFAQVGGITSSNIIVDGEPIKTFNLKSDPRIYTTFTNESKYMFIRHSKFNASGDINADAKSIYKILRKNNIAPIGTELISANLNNGIAKISLTDNYRSLLQDNQDYLRALDLCLALSISSLEGVEQVQINGEIFPVIAAINLEE